MVVFLDGLQLHQLATTTRSQVDQTYPLGYILPHMFIQRISNVINQYNTSLMYDI